MPRSLIRTLLRRGLRCRLFRRPMEDYRGRHCGCAPGTHATLAALVARHVAPAPEPDRGGVLDIGAHAGALLLRLSDRGFTDLSGTDLDDTRFDVPGAAFRKLELNGPFAEAFDRRFQLITCTDVIEHLDSPRNFFNQAHRMLHDGGYLALSLPNVAFWEGRIKFLLTGELWGFGARNYRTQRHISPITFEQMGMMLDELGFEAVATTSGGSFGTALWRLVTLPLWGPLRLIGGPHATGECAVFLARRRAPNATLKKPEHYQTRWSGTPDTIGLDDAPAPDATPAALQPA